MLPEIIFRRRNRKRNAKLLYTESANRITEGKYIHIGGIEQWITIRGEDLNNPVLLFIHGGPASVYSIFNPLLRSWEKDFTIVQWDQRGAGKTFRKNGKDGSRKITFERLAQDGIELTQYLSKTLKKDKIVLIGSSVGSLIATMMIKTRPDLYYAYVGTDQNAPDPENIYYQLMVEAFQSTGNQKGLKFLEKIGKDHLTWSRKDYDKMNQYLVKSIEGVPNMIMDLYFPSMLSSPDHKLRDIFDIFNGMSFSLDHLYDEFINFDIKKFGVSFEIPYFIFQGESDILTPTTLAEDYFKEIEAPYKDFVLIKEAGHLACFARPDQFMEELKTRVIPFIKTSS